MKAASGLPFVPFVRLAGAQPMMLARLLHMYLMRQVMPFLIKYELAREDRAPLKVVSLKLTDMCNLRCRPCAQWGENGYNVNQSLKELKRRELPVAQYTKLVDEMVAAGQKPFWYLWGGEPFMYPGIMDIVAAARRHGMNGAIVTNGYDVDNCAKDLVRLGWALMNTSQDGTADIMRKNRPGASPKFDSYKQIENATVALARERRDQGKSFPIILTLSCITSINQHNLVELVVDAQRMGADAVMVFPAWFTTMEDGLKHDAEFERRFGVKPFTWRGYVADCHDVDVPALREELKRLKSDPRIKIPTMLMPDIAPEQLDEYYQDHSSLLGYQDKCFYPWGYCEVQPNGDVVSCRDYSDYVCGNITQEPLLTIWNGERYAAFRRSLRDEGLMPVCSRCCGLMGI